MKYIKATPLLVQKLWYKLKFLERQSKGHKVIDLGATYKNFIFIMHAGYEVHISYCSKVMTKVQV